MVVVCLSMVSTVDNEQGRRGFGKARGTATRTEVKRGREKEHKDTAARYLRRNSFERGSL